MNSSGSSVVPLQLASLCLDCEMITPTCGRCIACGSVALLNVARMLSRPGAIQFSSSGSQAVPQVSSRLAGYGDFLQST